MKTMLRIAAIVLVAAGLTACATMGESSASLSPQVDRIEADQLYMSRVEEIARRRGIQVTWVNPPVTRPELVATAD